MIGTKQNDLGTGLRILNIKCPLRYNEFTKETERKQALGRKKKKSAVPWKLRTTYSISRWES